MTLICCEKHPEHLRLKRVPSSPSLVARRSPAASVEARLRAINTSATTLKLLGCRLTVSRLEAQMLRALTVTVLKRSTSLPNHRQSTRLKALPVPVQGEEEEMKEKEKKLNPLLRPLVVHLTPVGAHRQLQHISAQLGLGSRQLPIILAWDRSPHTRLDQQQTRIPAGIPRIDLHQFRRKANCRSQGLPAPAICRSGSCQTPGAQTR